MLSEDTAEQAQNHVTNQRVEKLEPLCPPTGHVPQALRDVSEHSHRASVGETADESLLHVLQQLLDTEDIEKCLISFSTAWQTEPRAKRGTA